MYIKKILGRAYLQGCHKVKLVKGQNTPKQMSLVESWLSFQPCFMIEQLTCCLSQRASVCTNKEADCCCPLWFIPLFCPLSALDGKLIKTLPCLLIPSQTARANHLPPFPAFIISSWTTPEQRSKMHEGSTCLHFQLELNPHYKMEMHNF